MEKNIVIEQVNEVFQSGFEIPEEKLKPEAQLFQDLGLDSLDAVDMLVHIEEKLGVRVDGERLMQLKTLGDVYQLVIELSSSKQNENRLT